ncbi:Carboxylesterase, partial [Ascodesmis nigricans]
MVANYFLPRLLAILLAILSSSIFAAPHFSSSTTHTPLVDTPYGQYKPNIVDKQHHFFAIPYAQPPINELRFRAPQPPESRSVHDAHTFGPVCPQPLGLKNPIDWRESEDCLTLNIFRPAVSDYRFRSEESLLPVMVFIHGGDMVTGGAVQYPLEKFVKVASEEGNPILAVSIQYRLGLLGFLDIEELDQKEKNLGFLDQRVALHWIEANIHRFGGDARRVTLMGHDSGAMSV